MGNFLETEKVKQTTYKLTSPTFSEMARSDGFYRTKYRPFCLPVERAEENLYPPIRETARKFFKDHGIKWHDGSNGNPSNHLCDSQVSCVNFLFPLADHPETLAQILRPHFPMLKEMLPIEDGKYVSFEWIGEKNYLGEKIPQNGNRTRGANCTSADAVVGFARVDGKKQIVLIEWKYTESYSPIPLAVSRRGTSRLEIYRRLYEAEDCPIKRNQLPGFEDLFFEPFYQLMRQQLLANEMEKAREVQADVVSLMHISPDHNIDFKRVTSERLLGLGSSSINVWKNLINEKDRFLGISTEELFGSTSPEVVAGMDEWFNYIWTRYPWVKEQSK